MSEANNKPASDLERYLRNEPINERLESLARGDDEEAPPTLQIVSRQGELDDDDRENLRHTIYDSGWPIVLQLWDDELTRERKAVEAMSMNDPLGNRDKISQGWAYVAMMQRTRNTLQARIMDEIAKLEPSERGQKQ